MADGGKYALSERATRLRPVSRANRAQTEREFRARLAIALSRRVMPRTGLSPTVLARTLNVSRNRVYCWMSGEATIELAILGDLIALLGPDFAREVLPETFQLTA